MKQTAPRLILAIFLGGALLTVGLITFLIIETRFFVQQARELISLKEDYVNYTAALRRMIAENESDKQEQSGLKKKA